MRLRSPLIASLLALSVLAACGGDDGDKPAAAGKTTTTTGAESGTDDTTGGDDVDVDADLAAAVDAAQLDVDDLGEGWELTGTKPAGEDDEESSPLDRCMDPDLKDRLDSGKVAETEERSFSKQGTGPVPLQVTSSSVAYDDGGLFDELHTLLRDDEFATCFSDAFEELVTGQAGGAEITIGDIQQDEGVVDADVESTGLVIPVSISAEGTSFDLEIGITVLSTGQLGSLVLVQGSTDDLSSESTTEWAQILAERLVDA